MAITLHVIEEDVFGGCVSRKNRFFGLAYQTMVEAATAALPNDQTMACPVYILVALLSGSNMSHWTMSGETI